MVYGFGHQYQHQQPITSAQVAAPVVYQHNKQQQQQPPPPPNPPPHRDNQQLQSNQAVIYHNGIAYAPIDHSLQASYNSQNTSPAMPGITASLSRRKQVKEIAFDPNQIADITLRASQHTEQMLARNDWRTIQNQSVMQNHMPNPANNTNNNYYGSYDSYHTQYQ
jgi:hypothetical protein